jgi:hypothetical protein
MRFETSKSPVLDGCPEVTTFNFEIGWTTMHTSRGLLQVQPNETLGKTLPSPHPQCGLSGHWKDDCPSLFLQGRSVSHSHSQQSEGLTDFLGLAAED